MSRDCLTGHAQAALMARAHAGQAARNNLAALSHKLLQQANVTVGDRVDLLGAELADLLAAEELASAKTASWAAGTGVRGPPGLGGAGVKEPVAPSMVCWSFRQPFSKFLSFVGVITAPDPRRSLWTDPAWKDRSRKRIQAIVLHGRWRFVRHRMAWQS